MQAQINKAFAALNARLYDADQIWGNKIIDAIRAAKTTEEKIKAAGSKAAYGLVWGRSREDALEQVAKNTAAVIAKRDATIIAALKKAGVVSIPDFTLAECSDGVEGRFNVAGHIVTIRTILAGGYNIQRLHQRTLVMVR